MSPSSRSPLANPRPWIRPKPNANCRRQAWPLDGGFGVAEAMIESAIATSIHWSGRSTQSVAAAARVIECATVNAATTCSANHSARRAELQFARPRGSDAAPSKRKPGSSRHNKNTRWSGPLQMCSAPLLTNRVIVTSRESSAIAKRCTEWRAAKTVDSSLPCTFSLA